MTKWEEKRLGEVAPFIYGKALTAEKRKSGKYKVFSSAGVCGFSDNALAKRGIIIGRKGSVGTVFLSESPFYCIDTAFYIDNVDDCCDMKFLFYYMTLLNLESYNNDAAVPGLNRNLAHKLKIKIPDLPTQQRIADILSTYDDLIENNNKRIALLEKAAQELYKEWFVRFRFPGHETTKFVNGLPEGWEVKKVKSLVNRLPFGTLYKSENTLPEGKVIVIDQSQDAYAGFHNDAPSHIASIENPIALFGDHSCKYQLMITPFSLSENVVPYTAKGDMLTVYLYYSLCGLVETSEYKRHWKELMSKKVLVAPHDLQKNFSIFLKDKLLLIESLKEQNFNLAKQRDLLLPRLMSGKLEV
jgi:type I restriction enzyme S subunit